MKKYLLGLALLPAMALAQNEMPPAMMQMLEQAEKARSCMAQVDQQALEQIGQEGEAMEAEVKALCDSGKRKQAQNKALAFSKDLMSRSEVKQMRECSEMMRGMMPDAMPFDNMEEDLKNRHVCDEL